MAFTYNIIDIKDKLMRSKKNFDAMIWAEKDALLSQ